MPTLGYFHVGLGHEPIGSITWDDSRRRWIIQLHGKVYPFREVTDAAMALEMLFDAKQEGA